ncbi:MAG: hypothetical protein Kow00120_14090 [Anaerolineae bacterium]
MSRKGRREASWAVFEQQVQEELEKARRRALLAESFDEMEEIAVEVGQRLQQGLLAAAAAQREAEHGRERCRECGANMERKGREPRKLKTSVGAVEIVRERWQCPACGASVFPPGWAAEADGL